MKIRNIFLMLTVLIVMSMSVFGQTYPTSYTINSGTYVSGSVNCLSALGVSCLIIDEVAQAPALEIVFNFTNVSSVTRANIAFQHSAGSDELDFEIWDYEFMLWQDLEEIIISTEYTVLDQPIEGDVDKFIQDGVLLLRIIHDVTGNPSHQMDIYSVSIHEDTIEDDSSCPNTDLRLKTNMFMFAILIFILLLGFFVDRAFGFLGSLGMLFYSFTIISCSTFTGGLLLISSLLLGLVFVLMDD